MVIDDSQFKAAAAIKSTKKEQRNEYADVMDKKEKRKKNKNQGKKVCG